jgi:hypothetical protein
LEAFFLKESGSMTSGQTKVGTEGLGTLVPLLLWVFFVFILRE